MISIRKATCDDGRNIAKLLANKYSFISVEEAAATYAHECRYQHYRIALIDNRPVGLISWRPVGLIKHGVVELTRIAVEPCVPQYRMVKERLFDVMMAEADYYYKQNHSKLRKVFSMIHADDRQIKNFFIDKGMRQEAILKDHYHKGKDELVFSLFVA